MQQGNLNLSWNTNSQFYGYVSDNNIYTYSGELIGVNLAKYQELEAGLKKCRDKLIELGVIVPEKTPEEIIKEQAELLKKQTDICNSLMNRLEVLENGFRTTQGDGTVDTDTEQKQDIECNRASENDCRSKQSVHKSRSSGDIKK